MKLLITGICGFVGSSLALWFSKHTTGTEIVGLDNFVRPGSETNRLKLKAAGISVRHADTRCASDFKNLPGVDWIIDAAANPSVLAGIDGRTSSRQLVEHNLYGTVNILEQCRRHQSGLILLTTSRVYSVTALRELPVSASGDAFAWDTKSEATVLGASARGIDIDFPTTPPISLYGSTKLASELLALEYSAAFSFPVWIDRCGVIAGAGQFGTPDQGIFSYWIHSYAHKRPLRYIGFNGSGRQVRDALHPHDLAQAIAKQLGSEPQNGDNIFNLGGGAQNAISLAQLTSWCHRRFGMHHVESDRNSRAFDVPWLVMDVHRAFDSFKWKPQRRLDSVLQEIADHAESHPEWLEISSSP
jgi:CDP-paratose 2-epimerase